MKAICYFVLGNHQSGKKTIIKSIFIFNAFSLSSLCIAACIAASAQVMEWLSNPPIQFNTDGGLGQCCPAIYERQMLSLGLILHSLVQFASYFCFSACQEKSSPLSLFPSNEHNGKAWLDCLIAYLWAYKLCQSIDFKLCYKNEKVTKLCND